MAEGLSLGLKRHRCLQVSTNRSLMAEGMEERHLTVRFEEKEVYVQDGSHAYVPVQSRNALYQKIKIKMRSFRTANVLMRKGMGQKCLCVILFKHDLESKDAMLVIS